MGRDSGKGKESDLVLSFSGWADIREMRIFQSYQLYPLSPLQQALMLPFQLQKKPVAAANGLNNAGLR